MGFAKKSSALPKKILSFLLALTMTAPLVWVQTSAGETGTDENIWQSAVVEEEAQDRAPAGETDVDEDGGQASDAEEGTEVPTEPEEESDPAEEPATGDETEDAEGSVETGTYANGVSGMLWLDMVDDIDIGVYAGDGIRQEEESPLAGYPVGLFHADDRSAAVQEAATDKDGRYEFTSLDPGTYVVGVPAAVIDGIEYLLPFCELDGTEGNNRFVAAYNTEMDAYLYAYTNPIEAGENTVVTDMDAGMRTPPGISPMAELTGDGIIVENEVEFRTALANAAYKTIYLGADITMGTSNNSIVAARNLVINGTDPREGGTRHTYTDYNGSSTTQALGGTCTNITFKDIHLNLRNYYGIYYVGSTTATTVTFENVTGDAKQYFYGGGSNTTFVIKDSELTLRDTGSGASQELAENLGKVRFEGDVTVRRDASSAYTYDEYFYFHGSGTVEVGDGANVVLDNSVNTNTLAHIFYDANTLKIGNQASFTCYSSYGFCENALSSLTIGQASDVRFIGTGASSHASYPLRGTTFTAETGSNFLIYENCTSADYSAFYFANVNLNNPESFIVLNRSARAIGGTYRPVLTATGVSSIRYYLSDQLVSLMNTGTYAYTPARNYTKWWAQSSPFHVTANTWPASSPTISTNYSNANVPASTATVMTSLASGNFSAASSVYGIEIYGTICTIAYDGNGAVSGSAPASDAGVPNDRIAVAGNPGNLARTNHTFAGWNTAADGTGASYSGGDVLTITEDITLYAQWTLDKYTVSGTLSGGSVGGLTVNYTINGGVQTVTADSSGSYAITDVPRGSDVVITPPAQTGYTANPPSITLNGISADSTGNDFSYTPDKYSVSGNVSGLADNSGVTVSYTIGSGNAQTVTTDSGGNYLIPDVPYGALVFITPPERTGFTVSPPSITLNGINADSPGNDFSYTRSFYTVTEKYVDELTGAAFQGDTSTTLAAPPYSYGESPGNITADGETYVYRGYKIGSYRFGDTLDGTGVPAIGDLTTDMTVYLIYHKVTGIISVTFPTGWDFHVDQDTYPDVKTGTMGDSGMYYSFENESDRPVYVDLTRVREIASGGLNLVADASLSAQGSSDYSLQLIPASEELTGVTNGFTDTVTGITAGDNTTTRLGALDGRYVRQTVPRSTYGCITIGGYYAGNLSAAEKSPQLTFTFTFSLIS